MADIEAELETPERYDLGNTMSGSRMGARDPVTRVRKDSVALALRTPEGAASLEVAGRPGVLEVHGWGEGAPWLVPHLRGLFGLEDDARAFAPAGGPLRRLQRRFPGAHLPRFPRVFDRVVRVVLRQLVTWEEACGTWARLVRELGEDSPGPHDLRLPPSAQALRETPDYALVALGVRPKQARTLREVAKRAARIERAATSGPDALAAELDAVRGVGPWTTGYVRGSALGCPDAVLLGDYNLPHTVAYVLAREPRASDERMLELLEPYRGHRFRVIRLLWMNGVSAPRRGPRLEPYRPR